MLVTICRLLISKLSKSSHTCLVTFFEMSITKMSESINWRVVVNGNMVFMGMTFFHTIHDVYLPS